MAPKPDPFLLENFLPYQLSVAANRVSRLFAGRYGATFGLTIPEWRAMAVLGRFGRLPAREIVARTAMDKVKVSRAVASLTARKLVLRKTDRADARLQWLELSAEGARIHAAIVPLARGLEEELLTGLDAAEVAVLRRALASISDRLAGEAEGID